MGGRVKSQMDALSVIICVHLWRPPFFASAFASFAASRLSAPRFFPE
ncbi:MAG: hypothetical protein JWP03_321 [Phycisphaerales bacterium]|nr:hypothetical protein [Phycisphaerales bacterium]